MVDLLSETKSERVRGGLLNFFIFPFSFTIKIFTLTLTLFG